MTRPWRDVMTAAWHLRGVGVRRHPPFGCVCVGHGVTEGEGRNGVMGRGLFIPDERWVQIPPLRIITNDELHFVCTVLMFDVLLRRMASFMVG